jgi:predicted transcriptional regulator
MSGNKKTLPDLRALILKMVSDMTTQTSIYLPDEVFAELARRAPRQDERSSLIAEALRHFFATQQNIDADLDRINACAEELNQEAEDVLDYQVML